MRRRQVLKTVVGGNVLLTGCTSTLSEPSNSETMTEARYPSFSGTVELDTDVDFWTLEMPNHTPSGVYKYEVENLTPEQGSFDILFFDARNYHKYVERNEPRWYTPLTTESVETLAKKESQIKGYGDGMLEDPLNLVIDNTDYAATTPAETGPLRVNINAELYPEGIGPKPDVGTIGFERVSGSEEDRFLGEGPDWEVRVDLAQEFESATLKINDCGGYQPGLCTSGNVSTPEYRRNLSDTTGVERFALNTDDVLNFDNTEYLFSIDTDDEVLAESIYEIDRSMTISHPEFEPFHDEDKPGKSGFSFRIENTGAAPLWLTEIRLAGDINGTNKGEASDSLRIPDPDANPHHSGYQPYWRYQLEPGSTERLGAIGVNQPTIDGVESVCDGETRTATLRVNTWSGFRVRNRLEYSLDEPAEELSSGRESHYVCQRGEIQEFNRIDSEPA